MNERIRSLIEKVVRIEVDPDSGMETIYTCGPEDFEAFAELIVEECILKAHGARIRGESINDLIERIRADFGIVEHEWIDEDPPC